MSWERLVNTSNGTYCDVTLLTVSCRFVDKARILFFKDWRFILLCFIIKIKHGTGETNKENYSSKPTLIQVSVREHDDLSLCFSVQVGLFRKSGVKSRIQALRQMNEASGADGGGVNYEGQSAYDVADMLKQYFRDLPEPLLTSKMSETFLQIYQCKKMLQLNTRHVIWKPLERGDALNLHCYGICSSSVSNLTPSPAGFTQH